MSIHGVEKTDETGRLCRLNLAVHGLEGEIKHGGNINSYYYAPHDATGRFDIALANPPFNVNAVTLQCAWAHVVTPKANRRTCGRGKTTSS